MQTNLTPAFRKTAATLQPGAKTLPQRYFVSPEIFAKVKKNAKSLTRDAIEKHNAAARVYNHDGDLWLGLMPSHDHCIPQDG